MTTLYLDCIFGVSGDMLISSLCGHLKDVSAFMSALMGISCYDDCTVNIRDKKAYGFAGKTFDIVPKKDLHLRRLDDIIKVIDSSNIAQNIKEQSILAFNVLAECEAGVHGVLKEDIHFHEVGAVDTIFDIVGFYILLDMLSIDKVCNSPINVGKGTVKCAHGVLGVPAPAVCELLKGRDIISSNEDGERATPTGSLLISQSSFDVLKLPSGKIQSTAFGFGKREFADGNYVKSIVVNEGLEFSDRVCLLECNIDDMTGEQLGYASQVLMDLGALDVWQQAIYMKKNRVGAKLSVLCKDEDTFAKEIFRHTTTCGIRTSIINRHLRGESTFTVKDGIRIKTTGDISKAEFEDVKNEAIRLGLPIKDIYKKLEEDNEL